MKKYYGLSKKSSVTVQEYFHLENSESYKNIPVTELNLSKRVHELVISNNCLTVADVLGTSIAKLFTFDDMGKSGVKSVLFRVEKYFSTEESLRKATTFENVINEAINSENSSLVPIAKKIILTACKNDKELSIIEWRMEEKTLSTIGKVFECSRERIRQIEEKVLEKFKSSCYGQVKELFGGLQIIVGKNAFISMDELKNLIGKNKTKVILFFMSKVGWDRKFFYHDKKADAIFLKNENYRPIDYDKLIYALPELITADNFKKEVARLIEQEHCDKKFLDLKLAQIYQRTGDFFHRNKLTLFAKFSYILRETFPDGYKISDFDYYQKFVQSMRENFNYDRHVSQRLLDGNISCYIGMLCDRGKYLHPDYVKVPTEIVELIRNFIENSERTAITYKEIFETLKENFVGTQITNHYFLQGLIRLYKFPYILRKDYVSKDPDVNITKEFDLFIKNHETVSAQDLKKYFYGFDDSNISLLTQRSPEIVRIGYGCFMHATRLNLRKEDFTEAKKFLDKTCENESVLAADLFESFKVHFEEFIARNKINTPDKLYGILRYMFKNEFCFVRPHIAKKSESTPTNKSLLLSHIKDINIISVAELENICNANKINFYTSGKMVEKLFPEFIRADQSKMCRPEAVGITDKVIAEVEQIIKAAVKNHGGWKAARTFEDFENFPKINLEWNSFLVENVANLSGNIKILRNVGNFLEYSGAVFVDETIFPEEDMDAFLLRILREEHEKNPFRSQEKMLSWLRKNGLRQSYIPKFLLNGGHLYRGKDGKLVLE